MKFTKKIEITLGLGTLDINEFINTINNNKKRCTYQTSV